MLSTNKLREIKEYCKYYDYMDYVSLDDILWMIKTIEELQLDQADYLKLQEQTTIVYDAITFGRVSHPFTDPYEVIREVEECFTENGG